MSLFSTQKQIEESKNLSWSGQELPFADDYQKITHCSALRRLQAKTQVWGTGHNDFFRTRLTHTLETCQIAEQLALLFQLPPHALRACALAHDLGHPPFAHEGASLIDLFCQAQSEGLIGFDDNVQNIRVLSFLTAHPQLREVKGLNLSAALIDGLQKRKSRKKFLGYREEENIVAWASKECGTGMDRIHPFALLLELADDISYACHDFEDALKAQMIPLHELSLLMFPSSNQATSSAPRSAILKVIEQSLSPHPVRLRECQEQCSRIKDRLLRLIFATLREITDAQLIEKLHQPQVIEQGPQGEEHIKNPIFERAPLVEEILKTLKELVRKFVIDQTNVQRLRFAHLNSLHHYLTTYWNCLQDPSHPLHQHAILSFPPRWRTRLEQGSHRHERLRTLVDYVVGMSDDYFIHRAAQIENPQNTPAFEIWT